MTNNEAREAVHNYLYNTNVRLSGEMWEALRLSEKALDKQILIEESKMQVKANLNNTIHVKLTAVGDLILKAKQQKFRFGGVLIDCEPRNKVDKNGYTEFQLWEFINIFGEHCYAGIQHMPYETNIIIDDAELMEGRK